MNQPHKRLLPCLLLLGITLLLVHQGCRALFLFSQWTLYRPFTAGQLLWGGFLAGLRFDVASLCALSLPAAIFVVLTVWVRRFIPHWGRLCQALFLLPQCAGITVNLIDAGYFGFTDRRSTLAFFRISQDIGNQIGQIAFHYWYLFACGLFFCVCLFLVTQRFKTTLFIQATGTPLRALTAVVLAAGLLTLGLRGGFQRKPLHPTHAFAMTFPALGHLALNTTMTMIHTDSQNEVTRLHFFESQDAAHKVFSKQFSTQLSSLGGHGQNVVVIIMESFGREYMGHHNPYPGYTPFLDSLIKKSVFFEWAFANGRRSIESLPSIFASIPSLMNETFILSPYQGNNLVGLPSVLKKQGYQTAFFHGGKNGTFFFDLFAKRAGFESYYGMNEYPHPEQDFDGSWGIFDMPFFQFFAHTLQGFREPFLAGFFSLSSHNPYHLPPEFKNVFPKGDLPIHPTISYADRALENFFKTAATMPWYKNTLFVITADHTSESAVPTYGSRLGPYWIPLLFFHPTRTLPLVAPRRVAQQADIAPTILHFLDDHSSVLAPFGHSLFDDSFPGRAVHKTGQTYTMVTPTQVVTWQLPQDYDAFLPQEDPNHLKGLTFSVTLDEKTTKVTTTENLKEQLQGYVQFYNNGLIENSWYQETTQTNRN